MDERFKKVEYYEIEYGDFDSFVEETFGREYECVADNEWNNSSSYDFDVEPENTSPDSFYTKYTLREVENWKAGNKSTISASSLLEYMVTSGILPAGKYLIVVSW